MERSANPGHRLAGPGRRRRRGDRRRRRHPDRDEPPRARHCVRIRLLRPCGRLRDLSRPHRVLVAGHLRSRSPRRPPQHAACLAARNRSRHVAGSSDRRGAPLERLDRVRDRERLRRGDAEHAAPSAAAVLVFAVAGAAWSARCAEPLARCVSLLPGVVPAKSDPSSQTPHGLQSRPRSSSASAFKAAPRSHRSSRRCSWA